MPDLDALSLALQMMGGGREGLWLTGSREAGPELCSHKEPNPTNDLHEPGSSVFTRVSRKERSSADTLISAEPTQTSEL